MAPAFAISPDEVVERLSRHFAAHGEGLVCAYLFGSFARGTPRAGSDVDVAVLHDREPGPTLAESKTGIESRLEAATGLPVDVVVLDTAPVELVHRVLRDGVLIHEADRSRRVRFEVRARNEYFDLKPILDQYRRAPGSPLVDRDLVLKKLAFVETCVRELRSLANLDASEHDVREERFVVHTLQLAIQAVLDAASHVVSDERLGEPQTNRSSSTCWRAPGGSLKRWPEPCATWRASGTSSCTAMSASTSASCGMSRRTGWTTCSLSRQSCARGWAPRTSGRRPRCAVQPMQPS